MLDLFTGYRIGPNTIRIIRTYWERLTIVAKAGTYCGHSFKGYQGVNQGDPLSPTIFNVVVDTIIRHWVTVVTPTEAGTGSLGLTIMNLLAYFYAYDGLVAPTQQERLQRAFSVCVDTVWMIWPPSNNMLVIGSVDLLR